MITAIALAALVSAASPVQGSVFGPVVSVKGTTFTITTSLSPTGKSLVSAGSARITEQATAPRSSLKVGACVSAMGTRDSKGVVAAQRISISEPVKGQCGAGFVRRAGGGRPPGTGTGPPRTGTTPRTGPPGGFRSGNFGFAFGSVTKMSGSTLTVKGRSFGSSSTKSISTTVTISSKTSLMQTVAIKVSAVKPKMCAFVRGASSDKGVTVKATDVALTPEASGSCTNGFRGAGR